VRDPPGGVTLNWKVRGPALESVAVGSQTIVLPIGWGDFCDGVMETMVTVAKAGAGNTVSSPRISAKPWLGIFMEWPSSGMAQYATTILSSIA